MKVYKVKLQVQRHKLEAGQDIGLIPLEPFARWRHLGFAKRLLGKPSWEQICLSSLMCTMNVFQSLFQIWCKDWESGVGFLFSVALLIQYHLRHLCLTSATQDHNTSKQVCGTALWQSASPAATLFSTSLGNKSNFSFPWKPWGCFKACRPWESKHLLFY